MKMNLKKLGLLCLLCLMTVVRLHAQTGAAFYVEPGGSIDLINNIIINNGDTNLNITTPPYNMTYSDVRVFVDAENNFFLCCFSPAVDVGNNNSVFIGYLDLTDTHRVLGGIIDLGAYEFSNLENSSGVDEQIACDSYTWINGVTYTENTDTPTVVLTNSIGCDSVVVLHLTINSSYLTEDTLAVCVNDLPYAYGDTLLGVGVSSSEIYSLHYTSSESCDSMVLLTLIVLENPTRYDTIVICESELPYTYGDTTFETGTSATSIYHHMTEICDSVTVLTLQILPTSYHTLDTTVLENDLPLQLNGQTYMTDSTFTQTFVGANADGCDSVLTVNMTVLYNDTVYVDTAICDNEFPFTWNGIFFATAGTQRLTYTAANGVDSVVVMTVNYKPTTYGSLDTVVLQNDLPFVYYGQSYSIPGVYTQTIENAAGCDSVVTIDFREIYNVVAFADSVVCAINTPFEWNGCVFTQTTVQFAHFTASTGADSMLVMRVKVVYTTYGSLDTTVLENDLPFVLNGDSLTTPGYHVQMLSNYAGCDSVLTVRLRVLYNVTVPADSTVCESELPLMWNDENFELAELQTETQTIVHTAVLTASTGVDSTVVMTLHVLPTTYATLDTSMLENNLPLQLNGYSYEEPGPYTQTLFNENAAGCDSILTVQLTVLYNVTVEVDSVVCETDLPLSWNGVDFTASAHQNDSFTLMDSVLLTASNGVDSTVVMTVVVNPTTYGTLDTTVVENVLPLMLNGEAFYTAGTYTQTFSNSNVYECDSVLTVHFSVLNNMLVHVDTTICQSDMPLIWNDISFELNTAEPLATPIILIDSAFLIALDGVDSTVVMRVMVNPTTYGTLDTTVLENNLPLLLNGQTYMTDSTFNQILTAVNQYGCDSVLTVNLAIRYNVMTTISDTICESQLPFTWNGMTFVADSIDQNTLSFTQSAVLTASTGVDSTVVMTLMVHYTTTSIDEQSACDSYTWIDGVTYTASTETATYILTDEAGCDSVVILHLTLSHSVMHRDTLVLVENQLPYYFAAADTAIPSGAPEELQFSYLLSTSQQCDSIIEQTVIIHYNTSETVDTMVCAASLPYTWHGHSFTGAGSYTDTLLNDNGSSHYVTLQLSLSNPTVTMQNIHHITCYGGSDGSVGGVLVSGGVQPYNCHWENPDGTIVSATTQLSNCPAGTYRLLVTDALGCYLTDSVMLNHLNDTMIAGVIANDHSVCRGQNLVQFTGTVATGGLNSIYQWQSSTNGTTWTPAQTPNNTQNYSYQNAVTENFFLRRAWMSAECGMVYSNVVSVSVLPLYYDTLHATVCQGYPYQDHGFDITTDETAVPANITRTRQLQSIYGCDSLVTLQLKINPVYELSLEDVVCEGDGYNNHGFIVPAAQTVGETEFTLTHNFLSQSNCDSIVNLHLTVVDTAIAIVSLTPEFCDEYTAELSVVTNMMNYMWNTGETSQTITVTQPGTYMVTANQDHCTVSAWYQIETCELNVYLPNTITPGLGDGVNDYFCLHEKYLPMIEDFEIRIFSRWGELVFQSNDKNFKWNGECRGRINRNIVYTYLINFTDSRGIPHQLTGSITVL